MRSGSMPSSSACLRHPLQGGHAVVERGGKRILRGQPVVRRHHDRTDVSRQAAGQLRLELRCAHTHSAAVDPQHSRSRRRPLGRREAPGRGRAVVDVMRGLRDPWPRAGADPVAHPHEGQRQPVERDGHKTRTRAAQFWVNGRQRFPQRGVPTRPPTRPPPRRRARRLSSRPFSPPARAAGRRRSRCDRRCGRRRRPGRPRAAPCRRRSPAAPSARAGCGRTSRP